MISNIIIIAVFLFNCQTTTITAKHYIIPPEFCMTTPQNSESDLSISQRQRGAASIPFGKTSETSRTVKCFIYHSSFRVLILLCYTSLSYYRKKKKKKRKDNPETQEPPDKSILLHSKDIWLCKHW